MSQKLEIRARGGSSNDNYSSNDFVTLNKALGASASSSTANAATWLSSPIDYRLNGYFYPSSSNIEYAGQAGGYWSATTTNGSLTHYLFFLSGGTNVSAATGSYLSELTTGRGVRCLAK